MDSVSQPTITPQAKRVGTQGLCDNSTISEAASATDVSLDILSLSVLCLDDA